MPLKLRPLALAYVIAVTAGGGAVIAHAVPGVNSSHPIVFAVLMALSLAAALAKITIPIGGGDSSLTICYVIDFTTLLACGPNAAVLVSAFGGWAQCTLRNHMKTALHGVVFTVATGGLAMGAAGWVYQWLGGQAGQWSASPQFEPFVAAATVVFLLNTIIAATERSLASRRSLPLVWFDAFLPAWPGYIMGAGIAAGVAIVLERHAYWLLPLLAGPLILLHRNFIGYLEQVRHSLTDPLTGLPNQRSMISHLERQLVEARQSGEPFAVIFVDLDGLKTLNDRGGHQVGDTALIQLGECLRATIRSRDVCARCGGDEFVVILADCTAADAHIRREQLQKAVNGIVINLAPGVRMSLSISAGIAVYPDDGDCQDQLLAAADRRMYEDKFQSTRPAFAPVIRQASRA